MDWLARGHTDLGAIAHLTHQPIERIEKAVLDLPDAAEHSPTDNYLAMRSWRVCPLCVGTNLIHQRLWAISFVTACPEHGVKLIDTCHRCGTPQRSTRPMIDRCFDCDTQFSVETAHDHEVSCSAAIASALELFDDGSKLLLGELLNRLMIAQRLSSSTRLRPHFRFSPQRHSVAQIREHVIRIWPAAASEEALRRSSALLSKTLSKRWPHLPNAGQLIGTGPYERPSPSHVESAWQLLDDNDAFWVPRHVASEAAQVSEFILTRLIDAGLIESKLFSELDGNGRRHKFRMVRLQSLNDLIQELHQNASSKNVPNDVPMRSVLDVDLADLVNQVRAQKIDLYCQAGTGLQSLQAPYRQTTHFAKRCIKPISALTSKEVCQRLNTYHSVVVSLVRAELIRKHRKSSSRRLLLTKASVEAFDSEFVLIGTVAAEHSLNPTNLGEKLEAMGFPAASGPGFDMALVKVFRRRDLADVNWEKVEMLQSYATKAGRRSSVRLCSVRDPAIRKLVELVQHNGGGAAFCRRVGCSSGTLSMIMREKKNFSRAFRKRLEEEFMLSSGWFTAPQS